MIVVCLLKDKFRVLLKNMPTIVARFINVIKITLIEIGKKYFKILIEIKTTYYGVYVFF